MKNRNPPSPQRRRKRRTERRRKDISRPRSCGTRRWAKSRMNGRPSCADYEDIKAKTEKEIEPLRKELESLKGKRDKFSNARKKEIQKEIGQKEEIYKSIPAQAENGHLDENQKFAEMVEEEARKKGIPEDRIPDFVTDFQIYSSGERPYIESNYNLSHREIFDELAEEYLAPEEEKEPSQPKAAIPAI